HDSRRRARVGPDGAVVLLEERDPSLWDRVEIDEGIELLERALRMRRPGPYQIQAAISALHARAERYEETDWAQIEALSEELLRRVASPVVELNHAVALAMNRGPAAGLTLLDELG